MARGEGSPQLQDGYTKVANEIFEELAKINLNASESRVVFFVIRMTYGWHKKADWLALSQVGKGTDLSKEHAWRAVRELRNRNIIFVDSHRRIGFNKHYREWIEKKRKKATKLPNEATFVSDLGKERLPNKATPVAYQGYKRLPNKATTKESKAIKTKEIALTTSLEQGFLNILCSLPSWEKDGHRDLVWLREFMADYPEFALGDMKGCRDYHSEGKLASGKGTWKVRLRNWAKKGMEFAGEGSRVLSISSSEKTKTIKDYIAEESK